MIYVRYTASKARKFITLSNTPRTHITDQVIEVSGKREANKICKENGYKAWNF